MYLLYLIAKIVHILLTLVLDAMFFRAILSWFDRGEGGFISTLHGFLALVTEPFILPVRWLLSRFPSIETLPVDISFFVTFLLLSLLSVILPVPVFS
ncbi:MAG: YggT family protein [Clostridia bacterium]|nr:YggT family protein [Clostridia bacterium]